MPAKRIQLRLPLSPSEPKMTSATISATLITHSQRHWAPRMSASMTVKITKAPTPTTIEKIWTMTFLVGLMITPPACIPSVAIYTAYTLKQAQEKQSAKRSMSARLKKSFI